jgi:hypothetical protein
MGQTQPDPWEVVMYARLTASLSTLIVAASAAAAPKPEPGDKREPRVWVEPSQTMIRVHVGSGNYSLQSYFKIIGSKSSTDRVRMDLRSGTKVVAAVECGLSDEYDDGNGKYKGASCEKNEMTAAGAFDVDVIFIDDQTDKEYVAATLKTNIRALKAGTDKGWAITPDDLLALAYAFPGKGEGGSTEFTFWTTVNPATGSETKLRCTAGSDKIEVAARLNAQQDGEMSSGINTGRDTDTKFFRYYLVELDPRLFFGKRPSNVDVKEYIWLAEHPGKWSCQVRREGKVLRELLFDVDAEGHFVPNPMQSGSKPLPLMPGEFLIDSRIPTDNIEERLRPDALKESIGYGLPWPDGHGVKEAQAAFPTAKGRD